MGTIEKSKLRSKATGSGAKQWMNCPASVAMGLNIIEAEKGYATEGTKAHDECSKAIEAGTPLEEIKDNAVRVYVQTVREMAGEGPVICEKRLTLLGSSGQVDAYAIRGKLCYLFDFKYGVGVKLYAEENAQLAFYACAIKEAHPEVTTVHAVLIQPRVDGMFEGCPSISSWTLPWQTIRAWKNAFEDALIEVEKAQEIHAGDWCQFCKARGGCPTYVAYAEATKAEQDNFTTDMIPAPGDTWLPDILPRVARILLARKQVESWFNKAEEFLLAQAKAGHKIPGFVLARGRSARKWHMMLPPEEIAEELIKRGCPNPYKPKALIGITEAEEYCKLDGLTEKPKGKEKLKPAKE